MLVEQDIRCAETLTGWRLPLPTEFEAGAVHVTVSRGPVTSVFAAYDPGHTHEGLDLVIAEPLENSTRVASMVRTPAPERTGVVLGTTVSFTKDPVGSVWASWSLDGLEYRARIYGDADPEATLLRFVGEIIRVASEVR